MAPADSQTVCCVSISQRAEAVYRSRWYAVLVRTAWLQWMLIAFALIASGLRLSWTLNEFVIIHAAMAVFFGLILALPKALSLGDSAQRTIASIGSDGSLLLDLEERYIVPMSELQGITIESCALFSSSARITLLTTAGAREITTAITPRKLYRFIYGIQKQIGPALADT